MYELKTLLPKFDIKVPTCMYPLKSVGLSKDQLAITLSGPHDVSETFDNSRIVRNKLCCESKNSSCVLDLGKLERQIQHILKESDDFAVVKSRQEKVLRQLKELKEQIEDIRSTLGVCQKGAQHIATPTIVTKMETKELPHLNLPKHDIVIKAHPKFIPYALLTMKHLWKSLVNIEVRCFSHSSITDIGSAAQEFQQRLSDIKADLSKPKIEVTLIWMDCEHTEMISSPTMYVPICGEVNILRYLSRVGPLEYRYENSMFCNEIDVVLDICYQVLRCNTSKSKSNFIRTLSNRLQSQKYFGVDQLSIADVAVHSSFKQSLSITTKDLTPVLNEWFKRVDAEISI